MDIVNNGMIVNLQISQWSGHKLDRAKTLEVTAEANAAADAARVNKHLISKEAMKDIISASGALRTHFYTKTLPWGDNGDRLLPRLMYTSFMQKFSELEHAFNSAVDEFICIKYPAARDQAEFRMGELFNPDDYPSLDDLRSKFRVNLDVHGVPTSDDFRVAMNQQDIEVIKQKIEHKNQERITAAMKDIWGRLLAVIKHFADRMQEDIIFRNSTIENLEELIEMLPALNITNDPVLEQIRLDAKESLSGFDPKILRKDVDARKMAAIEANRIVNKMESFMAAFK